MVGVIEGDNLTYLPVINARDTERLVLSGRGDMPKSTGLKMAEPFPLDRKSVV